MDGRRRRDKRRHDNKPNKRDERCATGGGVAAKGGFVGGIEGVRVTKGDVTTSQMRGMRGAVGDKSSSSCSCASINKTRNGAKMRSLSQREVTARGLTWPHRLHNCRGGSNDDNDAETTTTTTMAASIGSSVGMDAAAPLRQWSTTIRLSSRPTYMLITIWKYWVKSGGH